MSMTTECGESDVDVTNLIEWCHIDTVPPDVPGGSWRHPVVAAEARVPSPVAPNWMDFKLDHLTQKFQDMCVAKSEPKPSDVIYGPAVSSAIVTKAYPARRSRQQAKKSGIFNDDVLCMEAEHCFQFTQPGRAGFKMFLRIASGLHTRLRSLSEMDGLSPRSHAAAHEPRDHIRHNRRHSPYAPPTSRHPSKLFHKIFNNSYRLSRFNFHSQDARIVEVEEDPEPVLRRKPAPTLEEILRDGAKLPALGASDISSAAEGEYSADIDKVMRGLKYLAVK